MPSRKVAPLVVGALTAAFFLQSLLVSLQKSPSTDERAHIAAALSYVWTGQFRINSEHPPLLKELAGLSMMAGGIGWPDHPLARQALETGSMLQWELGREIFSINGVDHVLRWARLPLILVATLLVVVLFVWGRTMIGTWPAVAAVFLMVCDPNILAHSYLVTTDVGVTAFGVLFLFTLWRYTEQPTKWRMAGAGLALGAALLAKFSAVLLIPMAALLLLTGALRPANQVKGHAGKTPAKSALELGAKYFWGWLGMLVIAGGAILVAYVSPNGLAQYSDGLGTVNANHANSHLALLGNELAPRFDSYFVAAYLLKEPLASIILAIIGLVVLLRDKGAGIVKKAFLLAPPVAFLAAVTLWADDLGVRYLFPAFPFVHLLGGLGLVKLVEFRALWTRGLAAVMAVWLVVTMVAIYPDHLSYFNELAALTRDPSRIGWDGGTACGPLWLDDSNVDWGQGVKQLRDWQASHPTHQFTRVSNYFMELSDLYGIRGQMIEPEEFDAAPKPGRYVVSACLVARVPVTTGQFNRHWLRSTPPTAVVGHALYVYDIPAPAHK